jgi:hypothetical protein
MACLCEGEYVIKYENNLKESVLYAYITRTQTSSLFCLCFLFIAIKFTVLRIRVLWVNTEEAVGNEPNFRETHNKQKGKIRITARETVSDSNKPYENGKAV